MSEKVTVYFLYEDDGRYHASSATTDTVEDRIKYWLGKSPGGHTIRDILVVPDKPENSWLWVKDKHEDEELEFAREMEEKHSRGVYEKLKKRFEPE